MVSKFFSSAMFDASDLFTDVDLTNRCFFRKKLIEMLIIFV